jgi:D-glycerate 3-kinase
MTEDLSSLSHILNQLLADKTLSKSVLQQLEEWELADIHRATAFNIHQDNISEIIQQRIEVLQAVYPQLPAVNISHSSLLETLWKFWVPLAIQLAECRQQLQRPLIQGILGGQGTGKTTLAAILKVILRHFDYQTLGLSLDDLYKTYEARKSLQLQDSRLLWRGPPGTHDIDLGIAVLDQLRNPEKPLVEIPRFDKSLWQGAGDRTQPEIVSGVDIVLFEGWFVGVMPVDSEVFKNAPAPILTAEDQAFARDMNAKLYEYLPLWERLDQLMILMPADYRFSLQWRKQAEWEMKAAGKPGMSDSEIEEFVNYFWKSLHPELLIQPLIKNDSRVNLVVTIDAGHQVASVFKNFV